MAAALAISLGLVAVACNTGGDGGGSAGDLTGTIQIDGSSTVFPISQAVAETFREENPDVQVRVGQAGTGGGFTKFCAGDIDISDASRPIEDDEKELCAGEGIEYTELRIAIDGLSVVVNNANDFVECLTTDDLKKIWNQGSTVNTWKDINAEWPADEIKLYGPGADSGTFDYFTDVINGEEGVSRSDYTQSEDDNVLVQGVSNDPNALGYFGYTYLAENSDKLKGVGVDAGEGCVEPSEETIKDGSYSPLSRPLFIYISNEALGREEMQEFANFYVDNVSALLDEGTVKYVSLPSSELETTRTTLMEAIDAAGSASEESPEATG
jgi:phosphate transport system substrate-binding protein